MADATAEDVRRMQVIAETEGAVQATGSPAYPSLAIAGAMGLHRATEGNGLGGGPINDHVLVARR